MSDVLSRMRFHDLVHEAVQGTSDRSHEMERGCTVLFTSQSALNRADLPSDTAHAMQKRVVTCSKVSHTPPPYGKSLPNQHVTSAIHQRSPCTPLCYKPVGFV
jgi:hypothetical protein